MAVAVAQLVKRLLPTLEIRSSNPVNVKFYSQSPLLICFDKKRPGKAHYTNQQCGIRKNTQISTFKRKNLVYK